MSLSASSKSRYYRTVITLLDQLDPKEFNWEQVAVFLQPRASIFLPGELFELCGKTKVHIESSQIVSKFLIDRDRAGLFWVSSQNYADLARYILEFMCDR